MADEIDNSPVPPLGTAFDKARKGYGLSSALLLAWELIGIELGPAPIQNFNVTFKSPQAAPYVLLALVVYFAFRTTIEWFQADISRRHLRASKIDVAVAHLIGLTSILLYAVQAFLNVQLVDKVETFSKWWPVVNFLFGIMFGCGVILIVLWVGSGAIEHLLLICGGILIAVPSAGVWYWWRPLSSGILWYVLGGSLASLAVIWLFSLYDDYREKSRFFYDNY